MRVSKERDVALIKIEGISLLPAHIANGDLSSASTVYAVGSPLDERLSSSVTQGIVSGNCIVEGQNYNQSDTAISPGNSGGPLINSQGSVVGTFTAGMQTGGSQVGLNLFIPIESALQYLSMQLAEES